MQQAVFGVVGLGHIAQTQHLPNLARAPHARLKAECDLDPAKVRQTQESYQVPRGTTDLDDLLNDDEITAVVIATSGPTHVPLTLQALAAGKSVYVEKPLAEAPEECEAVVAAQRESRRFVAVGFNRRFAPAYVSAKQIIDQRGGAWNIHYRIADEYWLWGRNFPPGTRVIHEVCHIFDVVRWLSGQEVESVYCVTSRADDEVIALRMSGGCAVTIMDSGYATMDMPKEYLTVIVDRGGLTVEDFVELHCFGGASEEWVQRFAGHTHPGREYGYRPLYQALGGEALRAMRRTAWELRAQEGRGELVGPHAEEARRFLREGVVGWNYTSDKGWLAAIDHFAECVAAGTPPRNAGPEDGLIAARLAQAAIRSRETGQVVRL